MEPPDCAREKTVSLTRHKIKRYGWVADTPDNRDHVHTALPANLAKLPAKIDLRPQDPEVGHDDSRQRFFVRNPWGSQWGMGG